MALDDGAVTGLPEKAALRSSSALPPSPVLRYGVIRTAPILRAWQSACLEELANSGLARLECLIVKTAVAPTAARGSRDWYHGLCGSSDVPSQAAASTRAEERAPIFEAQIDTVRELGLDFLLLFGDKEVGLDLAGAAKYGVWYFAHSDIARFSTSTPCFWEIHDNHDVTGAALLKIETDDVAGVLLKSGHFPTAHDSFAQNVARVFAELPRWPARVCADINRGAASYFGDAPSAKPPVNFAAPNLRQILSCNIRQAKNSLTQTVANELFSTVWSVARIEGPPNQFIGGETHAVVKYLYRPSKEEFVADPCVIVRGSRTYLFCEQYRHDTKRGIVVASELSRGPSPVSPAIEERHHLSYPHVFEHEGEVFCIPESGGTNKVCLYRSLELPDRWQYARTLIDGFPASDSTVLKFAGKWWLFCTSSESFPRGHNSHLYIWYADDLFGKWMPHANNPVKIDARSSRPAGQFFTDGNVLYRPAQDCARSYGGAIRINRIDKLSETSFEERVVGVIKPPVDRYNKGIHTISAAGDWCIVDAKKYVFNPAGLFGLAKTAVKSVGALMGVRPQTFTALKRRFAGQSLEPVPGQRKRSV